MLVNGCYVPLVPGQEASLSVCSFTASPLLLSVASGTCLLLPREVGRSVLAGEVSLSTSCCFHWSSGIRCAQSGMLATGSWNPAIADFTLDRWTRGKKRKRNQHNLISTAPHSEHRFPAPSSKLCQIWLHHWKGTLYLHAAVQRRIWRPPQVSGTNKQLST